MTPDKLRARVVTLIVAAIIGLAFGLYLLVALLLWRDPETTLPGELWLAAGVFGGALVGFLSNSKGGAEGGLSSGPVPVTTRPGEALDVNPVEDAQPSQPSRKTVTLHRQPVGDLHDGGPA